MVLLVLALVVLLAANLFIGAVDIPAREILTILEGEEGSKASWYYIVWESRIPQCITALLCGSALSVSGLILLAICPTAIF